MRNVAQQSPLSVRAFAGSQAVLFGVNLEQRQYTKGLRGFAIECVNETDRREYWMLNLRRFAMYDREDGAPIRGPLGAWLKEVSGRDLGFSVNVVFIHDKFLLINPLGNSPVVVTGSANFSRTSTTNNDENMLIIKGSKNDTAVADSYLVEFMRLFKHYRFRAWAQSLDKAGKKEATRLRHLDADDATALAYNDEPDRIKEREQFGSEPE
jgi:phosphatidylserine/phosphatidylglycerophosphate/cardiolipin synthase-like enzyme